MMSSVYRPGNTHAILRSSQLRRVQPLLYIPVLHEIYLSMMSFVNKFYFSHQISVIPEIQEANTNCECGIAIFITDKLYICIIYAVVQ